MASPKRNRPMTAMQRGMSDLISYEDILVAQYMNDIEKSPPTRKSKGDVPVTPYTLTTQTGEQIASRRPKSAIASHDRRKQQDATRTAMMQGRVPFMAWDGYSDEVHVPKTTPKKKRPSTASSVRSRSSSFSSASSVYGSRSSKSYQSQGVRTKKSKPLYKKQPKVICIRAFQNGNRDNFARVTAPDLWQLLDACTDKLGLVSAARKLFFSDGTPVVDARQIERDADVYVSCGEAFKDPYAAMREELRRSASWTLSGIVLPENKTRGKTKTSLSKRMNTLVESQKRRILVFRNGDSGEGVEIVAGRFDGFLDDCTAKLKLESGARRLFDWEGNEIKSFGDVPVLDGILQPSTTTVLGPVWVTKGGERFSPKGAYNFLLTLLGNTKERLKYSKAFKEQLVLQLKHSSDVQSKEIMSMEDDEVQQEIQEVDDHIGELAAVVPIIKKQIKALRDKVDDENGMETYKYQHISEINADSRLLGKQGLRLKIFENGRQDGQVIVYFNLAEAEKGIQGDLPQLMHRFLDTCTSTQRVGDGSGGPAGRRIAKRVFLRDGTEIKNVYDLEYDQEVWLSYGEEFKPLNVLVLQLNIDKASCMSLWDEIEVIQREPIMDDEKGKDRPTAWKALTGFPPSSKRQLVSHEMSGPQKLAYAEGLKTARVDEKGCFLQHREKKNLVLYPEVVMEIKKKKGAKDIWPADAQEWIITQGGLIFSKAMPQLALTKSDACVQVTVGEETLTGCAVHLSKRMSKDPDQQWGFSPTGQIYSLAKPSLFLTYVGKCEVTVINPDDAQQEKQGQEETGLTSLNFVDMDKNDDEGTGTTQSEQQPKGLNDLKPDYAGQRYDVVLLPKLSGKNQNAGLQRWAIKQEDLSSIGQWKHTTVTNPEWNKKALSWPVTEDGNWNNEFTWPMEGFLLPFAPPVKRASEKKNTSTPGSAMRLRVLKNGDSDQSHAVIVVGPDLTNMWHDVSPNSKKNKSRKQGKQTPNSSGVYEADACHPLDLKKIELELKWVDIISRINNMLDNEFLDQCTTALGLPFAARKLFTEEGQEVTCISDLSRDQLVYVSSGEAWSDPQMSYSEQQRRALLMNLACDIARIRQYCALRQPQDLVLTVSGPVEPGAKIVVGGCALSSAEREQLINSTNVDEEQDEQQPSAIVELSQAVTAHERSHQRAEERLKTLRYTWENDVTSQGHHEPWEDKDGDFDNEVTFTDPLLQHKFRQQAVKSADSRQPPDPTYRQKWHYSDGFIHLKKNSQLVLGLQEGLNDGSASNEVVLCKKKVEDPAQRWIISEDGSICLRCNVQLVLTVTTPPLGNDPFSYDRALDVGFNGSAVIVANRKLCPNGNAHQLWSFDRLTGFIESFAGDTINKETTAANKANVCTYAVLGPKEVYQPGYVYMQGTSRQRLLCEACGKASRGRNKLQKIKESKRFSCALGSAGDGGSDGKFTGCFKCLNSKVDLSSLEAESTLELWEYQLDRLRNEGSARTIAKELSVAKSVPAMRILAYKNGEGSRGQGVLVIGTSIHSLLDQATTRLGLTQAARRMYTVRGELITDINQLIKPYSFTIATNTSMDELAEQVESKAKLNDDTDKKPEKLDLKELETQAEDDEESGNDTYRLGQGRTRRSLPAADPAGIPYWDTRWPIDVWISCGEPFVPLEEADKQYLLSMKHREERTWVQAYLDMEKHVLRHMQGRRICGSTPPSKSPVHRGSWAEPTVKEGNKEETINQLQMHLYDVKSRQRSEQMAMSKGAKETTQRLYSTPKTIRVQVYPNGETMERSAVVYGASIREILDNSTSRLNLNSAARRLFKTDGNEVLEMEQISRGDILCVSCGDSFMRARDRRHQMELKATWSRLNKQTGALSTKVESAQLSLPAPSSPPPPSGGRRTEGCVTVHSIQSKSSQRS